MSGGAERSDGTEPPAPEEPTPPTPEGPDAPAPADEGTAADDPFAGRHTLWARWTDLRTDRASNHVGDVPLPLADVHIHRFCDLLPGLASESPAAGTDVPFRFVRGLPRAVLRFTPLWSLGVVAGLVAYGELSPAVGGIGDYLPPVSAAVVGSLVAGALLWSGIVYLAGRVGLVDGRELLKAVTVWGLAAGLLAGSLFGAGLVLTAADPTALPDNVVYLSGYLLMLLLGGLLVYDGALRTETLFSTLPAGNGSIVADAAAYRAWRAELQDRLDDTTPVLGLPTSHVFAALFVAQFAAIWTVGSGPQTLGSPVTLAVNLAADFVLVVVAFRFLVLVKYVYLLMTDQYVPPGASEPARVLRYEPFHYDRRGGFRDFGRFATRVNLLLLIGGLYTVYRLYVQGLRVLPAGGLGGFETRIELVLWAGNFALPVVAYALAAAAWVYYSFWAIHRKMMMDKRRLTARHQDVRGGAEPLPTVGDSIEDFEGGVDYYYLDTAPEWPIDSRVLASVVSANAVPLLLPLLKLLG